MAKRSGRTVVSCNAVFMSCRTGEDVTYWMSSWVLRPNYPVLHVSIDEASTTGNRRQLVVRQASITGEPCTSRSSLRRSVRHAVYGGVATVQGAGISSGGGRGALSLPTGPYPARWWIPLSFRTQVRVTRAIHAM